MMINHEKSLNDVINKECNWLYGDDILSQFLYPI